MPKGGARFTSQELAQVLSHYDIGIIQQIKPLTAGNRRAPKQVVISDTGKYLLKRRAQGKTDMYRVTLSHSVQNHLHKKSFCIPKLIETCDDKDTILEIDHHVYELFEFVPGSRFDGSAESVRDAGRVLADFHTDLSDFPCQTLPIKRTFHDSSQVRQHLKKICSENNGSDPQFRKTTENLMTIYNHASVSINQCGFDSWDQQIVHGDWHPGNMLFLSGKVSAVLDFDSLKVSPTVIDLANGMLQYSIVGGRPNPADWPDYLDQAKFAEFVGGYLEKRKLNASEINTLIDLMTETLIAEAVLPIATTGSFIHLSGGDFLNMIFRKCSWMQEHRQLLTESVEHTMDGLK